MVRLITGGTMAEGMNNRSFYKKFFSIYIALVLQNVVTLSVNLADNIMLGDRKSVV